MLWNTKTPKKTISEADPVKSEEDIWIEDLEEQFKSIKDHAESIASGYLLGLISEDEYYKENGLLMFRLDQMESDIRKHHREQLHREKKDSE